MKKKEFNVGENWYYVSGQIVKYVNGKRIN